VESGTACDDCHATKAWVPARFNHDQATSSCVTCHNGITATGKAVTHITSGNVCEDCHSTAAWIPAQFDHADITSGCNTCHNGGTATGMDTNHFVTSEQCDVCHRTTAWIPTLLFDHQSTNYPGDHTGSNPSCIDCHTSNSQNIIWSMGYTGECAGCHANDYELDKHENNPMSPDYIDCSSTCHKPDPQHRVNHSDWGQ